MSKKENSVQPARISYFFGSGFKDAKEAISLLWEKNREKAQKYYFNYKIRGVVSINGISNLFKVISLLSFGFIFSFLFTLLSTAVLSIAAFGNYLVLLVLKFLDKLYSTHYKISVSCPYCLGNFALPIYVCSCGAKHDNLTPGKYGIWRRTCICGRKLPTNWLNGRNSLQAICPICFKRSKEEHYLDKNETSARPVEFPIIGGRSVGKTAFITAFSCEFIDKKLPEKNFNIEFYNNGYESDDKKYAGMKTHYIMGDTEGMTDRINSETENNVFDFRYFVKGPTLKPNRIIHMYDIAGEVFTEGSERQNMLTHLKYASGIILMIDPLSFDNIFDEYKNKIAAKDRNSKHSPEINRIYSAFMDQLHAVVENGEAVDIPVAIVISKADLIKEHFAQKSKLRQLYPNVNESDIDDYLCRELLNFGEGGKNFVNAMDLAFKNVRFFPVSAIGHTVANGRYTPNGIFAPVEWICSISDNEFKKAWSDAEFTEKNPLLSKNDK